MNSSETRLFHIDFLRSLLTFYIVGFWHIDDYAGNIFFSPATELIIFAVLNTFIFISSYILSTKYDNMNTAAELKSFVVKRVLRIYPLYLLSLLLFYYFFTLSNFELISQIFLFNLFSDTSVFTLWFIGLIFNYYIIFSLICYKSSLKKIIISSLLFLLVCGLSFFLTATIDARILLYYPSFIIGILYYKYTSSFYFFEKASINLILSAAAITLLLFSQYINSDHVSKLLLYSGGTFLVFPFLFLSKKVSAYLNNATVSIFYKISYASFCMYIFHRIVYYILLRLYPNLSDLHKLLFLYFVGIPLLIIISYVVQYCYDVCINYMFNRETIGRSQILTKGLKK